MDARLPAMLKDAAVTALVAAALGVFIVGFRTYDVGRGLTFDFQLVDLGIAVVTIFFGRLGLQLASIGLKWPAFVARHDPGRDRRGAGQAAVDLPALVRRAGGHPDHPAHDLAVGERRRWRARVIRRAA